MKKISDDIAYALDKCAEAVSIHELSRVTGVRIELLRRFITRKTRHARVETWDKIYPVLKPYLTGQEKPSAPQPIRIGRTYRRIKELTDFSSNSKILLDVYDMLPEAKRKNLNEKAAKHPKELLPGVAALSAQENLLLGFFNALPEEEQQTLLFEVLETATVEAKRRRTELF